MAARHERRAMRDYKTKRDLRNERAESKRQLSEDREEQVNALARQELLPVIAEHVARLLVLYDAGGWQQCGMIQIPRKPFGATVVPALRMSYIVLPVDPVRDVLFLAQAVSLALTGDFYRYDEGKHSLLVLSEQHPGVLREIIWCCQQYP